MRRGTAAAAAAVALTFAASFPANAWGGATSFNGNKCSGYSTKTTANGQAGANTVDVSGTSLSLRVAFRGGGHLDIAPQTGTIVVRSFIDQAIVSSYPVVGGRHTCGGPAIST